MPRCLCCFTFRNRRPLRQHSRPRQMQSFSVSMLAQRMPAQMPVPLPTASDIGFWVPRCESCGLKGIVAQVYSAARYRASVHPHVRGEYELYKGENALPDGSSPRAWGIPPHLQHRRPLRRFIPTCVGNTARLILALAVVAVHPHVRGEYSKGGYPIVRSAGSSPRAWGIHSSANSPSHTVRFIPTCVGNTITSHGATVGAPVHPHVRGEYILTAGVRLFTAGSSPRAWGIQVSQSAQIPLLRFIPTCVGNT